jgi:hypothetical protein
VAKLLSWQHSGFSVDNQVRIEASNSDGRQQLARYMTCALFPGQNRVQGRAVGDRVSPEGACHAQAQLPIHAQYQADEGGLADLPMSALGLFC